MSIPMSMSMAYVQPSTQVLEKMQQGQYRRRTRTRNGEKSMGEHKQNPTNYLCTPKDSRFPRKIETPRKKRVSECKRHKREKKRNNYPDGNGSKTPIP
jgi:hypothetical protein